MIIGIKLVIRNNWFEGEIIWDENKPDGTPRKLLDVTKAKQFGWESSITLLDGIRMTYDWYVKNEGI